MYARRVADAPTRDRRPRRPRASSAGAPASPARQRILDTAYELFSHRGIRAVGVEEVISRADIAKATLYRHFRSKDDLVLAFLEQREDLWTRQLVEAGARERGARPPRSVCSPSSTSSTTGSNRTTSKAAPSSTSFSRPPTVNTPSARRAPNTSRTFGRSCARSPKRPISATPRPSPSPGTCS